MLLDVAAVILGLNLAEAQEVGRGMHAPVRFFPDMWPCIVSLSAALLNQA
jgi:hypothetical protein